MWRGSSRRSALIEGVVNLVMRICLVIGAVFALANTASADLENENLLTTMPPGYKVDFQQRKGNMLMTEMVPVNESVNNWTEMITVQIFYGLKNVTPEQFKARMEGLWQGSCPNSTSKALAQGVERGYPTGMWVMSCPLNSGSGKPENTWFKAIQGADSFYVVQKAYKFTPSKEQESKWVGYLRGVAVYDSRVPARACPKVMP
jgi:hypothetical protein